MHCGILRKWNRFDVNRYPENCVSSNALLATCWQLYCKETCNVGCDVSVESPPPSPPPPPPPPTATNPAGCLAASATIALVGDTIQIDGVGGTDLVGIAPTGTYTINSNPGTAESVNYLPVGWSNGTSTFISSQPIFNSHPIFTSHSCEPGFFGQARCDGPQTLTWTMPGSPGIVVGAKIQIFIYGGNANQNRQLIVDSSCVAGDGGGGGTAEPDASAPALSSISSTPASAALTAPIFTTADLEALSPGAPAACSEFARRWAASTGIAVATLAADDVEATARAVNDRAFSKDCWQYVFLSEPFHFLKIPPPTQFPISCTVESYASGIVLM